MTNRYLINPIIKVFIIALMILLGQLAIAQQANRLTLPREKRLNQRQPPDQVLNALGIKEGMVIGEVGAGRGRYTVQIADRVGPSGVVYANDINKGALDYLRRRCEDLKFDHVKIIHGTVTETNLPKNLDMIIMVNVVHCLEKPVALLSHLKHSLKSDGRIAIVEGNRDKRPDVDTWFSRSKLVGIFRDSGYEIIKEEDFLPSDNIFILKIILNKVNE